MKKKTETKDELVEDVTFLGKAFDIFYENNLSEWIEDRKSRGLNGIWNIHEVFQGGGENKETIDIHDRNDLLNFFIRTGLNALESDSVFTSFFPQELPIQIICRKFISNESIANDLAFYITQEINDTINEDAYLVNN